MRCGSRSVTRAWRRLRDRRGAGCDGRRPTGQDGHGPRSPARDRTITWVTQLGRRQWKQASWYDRQGRVENTFFRYTSIVGDGLRARSPTWQGSEAVLGCEILNRMTALGRPVSYPSRRWAIVVEQALELLPHLPAGLLRRRHCRMRLPRPSPGGQPPPLRIDQPQAAPDVGPQAAILFDQRCYGRLLLPAYQDVGVATPG